MPTDSVRANPPASVIRRMLAADIRQVAGVQLRVLQESALTQLGARFLIRFYQQALLHPSTHAFVACDAQGSVVGAVLAAADVGRFNAFVTPRILPPLAVSLLSRWGLAVHFAGSCLEKGPARAIPAELLLLFVDEPGQRTGTGTQLLETVEDAFIRAGIAEYRVSVRSELENALAFYAARGFQHDDELRVLGRPMTYLTKRLGA